MVESEETAELANKAGALTKMVGAIVIYYATVEHWLDGIVFVIHDHVPGAQVIEKRHPYNGQAEFDFLKACFQQLHDLAEFKAEGLALIDKVFPLSDFRHNVVHGWIRNIDWANEVFEFSRKFKGPGGVPVRRTLTCSAVDLFEKGREIKDLIEPLNAFTQRLLHRFDPTYNRKEAAGHLGWTLPGVFPVVKKVGD